MAARLRGAVVLDVAAAELPAARAALVRALASGALGAGFTAALDSSGAIRLTARKAALQEAAQ